jgi:adenosylcobinamide-phosphate synthase
METYKAVIDLQASAFSIHPLVLIIAFLLDLAIGDPQWLPHPVRVMGRFISGTEMLLRGRLKDAVCKIGDSRFEMEERLRGILLVILIIGLTLGVSWLTVYAIFRMSRVSVLLLYCSTALLIYLTSTTIAVRGLIDSGKSVIESVKDRDIDSAKSNLSMIVGRDTRNLSEKEILKATIETLSENLSDGIIAPLFYLIIGGLPLAMTYKAINTLDSMVGYKNDRYRYFGWAAAKLDDIANFVPARLTGLLIVIATFIVNVLIFLAGISSLKGLSSLNSFRIMLRDGRNHLSPNAGIPEAAMAGSLGVRLGGPSTYGGILIQKPYIGDERMGDYLSASERAIKIVKVASIIGVTIAGVVLYAKQ